MSQDSVMGIVQMEKKFHYVWTVLTQLKSYLEMANIVVVMECLHVLSSQSCKNSQYSIVDTKHELYPSVRQSLLL